MPRIQDAVKNIAVVIANSRMTQSEHEQLKQDVLLIAGRCERADELEKQFKKELKTIGKKKKPGNGKKK